jgi:hypothetical protein
VTPEEAYAAENPPRPRTKLQEYQHAYARKVKTEACLMVTGGLPVKCAWCDCADLDVLTIDHRFADGAKTRQSRGHRGGMGTYLDILHGVEDPERLQILCFNHNKKKATIDSAAGKLRTRGKGKKTLDKLRKSMVSLEVQGGGAPLLDPAAGADQVSGHTGNPLSAPSPVHDTDA